jgi:hypothetical protein
MQLVCQIDGAAPAKGLVLAQKGPPQDVRCSVAIEGKADLRRAVANRRE